MAGYNPDDPNSGPYVPSADFEFTPSAKAPDQYSGPIAGPTPLSREELERRNNIAFQHYQPQNGVGGGQNHSPAIGPHSVNRAPSPSPDTSPSEGGPGSQYFAAQALPGDFNMQWGGPSEQFYANTQGQYQQPSMSEAVFAKHAGQLNTQGQGVSNAYAAVPGMTANGAGENWYSANAGQGMGHTGNRNMATQVFNQFQSSSPQDMSAYYDNAGRQALERINQNAAARGSYGSSAALAEGSESLTNLAADRAKAEADYGLKRFELGGQLGYGAEQSQNKWFDSVGNQAFKADEADLARQIAGARTGLDADRTDLDRISTQGDLAGQGDQSWMNRLQSGQNAASTAQNDRQGRIDQLFKSIFGTGDAVANLTADGFAQMMEDQLGIQTNANNASLGAPATALSYDTYEANQHSKEYSDWMDMFTFGQGGQATGGGGAGP